MTSRFFRIAAVATAFSAVIIARAQDPPKCHVPASECERSIRQMLSGRRYLGLDIVEIKPGLVIKAVHPDSPASRADFHDGDRLIAVNATAARIFEGRATTVISEGRILNRAIRRLGLRRTELEQAVRWQNADDVAQIEYGSLEPSGHLLLSVKAAARNATKADIDELADRLHRIESLLSATR